MIRLKHTILLVSMAFAGACATADADADAPASTPMQARPTTMDNHGCLDANPGLRTITINFNQPGDTIVVAPHDAGSVVAAVRNPGPPIRVGDVLQFHLVGANETLVSISGKTPKDGWLNGNGKTNEKIPMSQFFYICVPKDLVPYGTDETFAYDVDAYKSPDETWPQLDPKVTVRNP